MDALIKSPEECTADELNSFEKLVREGGEVTVHGLRQRIEQAERLVFIINQGCCIAVGAIKNPNNTYKERVFAKAGVSEKGNEFKYELGWLYVTSSKRGEGLGHSLMKSIIGYIGYIGDAGCYATTREDNNSMHHLFSKYSFNKIGKVYPSENGYSLVLYANKP